MKAKTYSFSIVITILSLLLNSCLTSSALSTSTPNTISTFTPQPTSTPIITSSPTDTPTSIPPSPIITPVNIMKLQEYFRIGMGFVTNVVYMNNENIAALLTTGLIVYNSKSGDQIKYIQPKNNISLQESDISPDGKRIASLVNDNKVLVWNTSDGEIEYELETKCQAMPINRRGSINFSPHRIAFSSNGSRLAICDEEGVSLWDTTSWAKISTFKIEKSYPYSILFSPKDNTLATSSFKDNSNPDTSASYTEYMIWDLKTGEVIKKSRVIIFFAPTIGFNHQGNIFAWNDGSTLNLYGIDAHKIVQSIKTGVISAIEFSPDDKTVVISGNYGTTKFLDADTGKLIYEDPDKRGGFVIKYSPDGKSYVFGSNTLLVKNSETHKELATLSKSIPYTAISFNPKKNNIAVGGFSLVSLWDLQKRIQVMNHISAWSSDFLFDSQGDNFITLLLGQQLQEWDLKSINHEDFEGTFSDTYAFNNPPTISPSTNIMAIGMPQKQNLSESQIKDGYIKFWNTQSRKYLFEIRFPNLFEYKFSQDGKIFAAAGNQRIELWDPNSQKKLRTIESSGVLYGIDFSPDGTLIAGGQNNKISIWETSTGKLVGEFNDIRTATIIKFSPQGNVLAAIGYVGNNFNSKPILYVWDIPSKKLMYTIDGDDKVTFDIPQLILGAEFVFSPDGSFIVAKGFNDYIQIFASSSGELIKIVDTFKVDNASLTYNSFNVSPDGRNIAIAAIDGNIHLFNIRP